MATPFRKEGINQSINEVFTFGVLRGVLLVVSVLATGYAVTVHALHRFLCGVVGVVPWCRA